MTASQLCDSSLGFSSIPRAKRRTSWQWTLQRQRAPCHPRCPPDPWPHCRSRVEVAWGSHPGCLWAQPRGDRAAEGSRGPTENPGTCRPRFSKVTNPWVTAFSASRPRRRFRAGQPPLSRTCGMFSRPRGGGPTPARAQGAEGWPRCPGDPRLPHAPG